MNEKKIRLLHLIKSCGLGGAEKSTILYSNNLVTRFQFIGIYASRGFFDNSSMIAQNVQRIFPPHQVWRKFHLLKNLIHLLSVIKTNKITHIHYHHRIFIPFIILIRLIYSKIEVIYTHHNIFKDSINYLIIADKIIVFNQSVKNDLPNRLLKRTYTIPHGVQIPKLISKKKQPINFGYVGRFVSWKGILGLIDSFHIVLKKYPYIKLFLIGDGELKNQILEKIEILNLKDSVNLVEPQSELSNIYLNLDVLILPSKVLEAFGMVLIEAMSFGVPVIVFDNSTFKDIVTDNYNSIITKKNLSDSITKIIAMKNFYKELSLNSVKTARKYELKKIIEKYILLYTGLPS